MRFGVATTAPHPAPCAHVHGRLLSGKLIAKINGRMGHMICEAQCKMQIWGPLFKNHCDCPDSNSPALNKAQGPSQLGGPCSRTGEAPMQLALTCGIQPQTGQAHVGGFRDGRAVYGSWALQVSHLCS